MQLGSLGQWHCHFFGKKKVQPKCLDDNYLNQFNVLLSSFVPYSKLHKVVWMVAVEGGQNSLQDGGKTKSGLHYFEDLFSVNY